MDWAGKGSSCLPETRQEGRHNGRKGSGTSALEASPAVPCHPEPHLENSVTPQLSLSPLSALGQSGAASPTQPENIPRKHLNVTASGDSLAGQSKNAFGAETTILETDETGIGARTERISSDLNLSQ